MVFEGIAGMYDIFIVAIPNDLRKKVMTKSFLRGQTCLKTSVKSDIFWSEIGSGFEELGSTPPPFPMSKLPFTDGIKACGYYFSRLRRRHNLTLVSNVCESAPTSLLLGPQQTQQITQARFEFLSCNRLNKLLEVHFKFLSC